MRRLASSESGFTLVELLIAMVVMAIGISAIVAGYSSGLLAVNRARLTSTVGTLADKQMEFYRQAAFTSLTLGPQATDGPQTGSDGKTYWVGTTISWTCVVGNPKTTILAPPICDTPPESRPVKLVAIEVHNGSMSSDPIVFSESSTFDSSTG